MDAQVHQNKNLIAHFVQTSIYVCIVDRKQENRPALIEYVRQQPQNVTQQRLYYHLKSYNVLHIL